MTEDVWSEQDTSPDDIEAALRELLRRRHAADPSLVPARVLNLIVIASREWKGEIANRLERVGRYRASRTILCTVEPGRTTLDAVMAMSYDDAPGGSLSAMHEKVEIEVGPDHLARLDTIVDPVLVAELPTMVWSPHGYREAVRSLLHLTDVVLLDSDDHEQDDTGLTRASKLLERAYVVDLAWLRTTPWRERLAASFDPPDRRGALLALEEVTIRHHPRCTPSAALLAGWLASRLQWSIGQLSEQDSGALEGTLRRNGAGRKGGGGEGGGGVKVTLAPVDQEAPGLAGVTVGWEGRSLSLDRGRGGLHAHELFPDGRALDWQVLGASRGEGGILGEGVRQALLRDATYEPALQAALELAP